MNIGNEYSDRVMTKPRQHRHQPTPIMQMMAKTSAFDAQTARSARGGTVERVIPAPAKHPSLNSTGVAETFEPAARTSPAVPQTISTPRAPDLVFGEHIKDKNPYLTTTQMFFLGQKTGKKKKDQVKVWMEITPEMTVNPLTGQPIESMVKLLEGLENAKRKDAAEQAAQAAAMKLESDYDDIENKLMTRLKQHFQSRGVTGIMGLSRKFRIMDDDSSKSLSYPEFAKAMSETGLNFNQEEVQYLFSMFDVYDDGFISYEEFVDALAGDLNKRRKMLVNMAFDILDRDGSGRVDIQDFALIYDTSKHPDVLSGKKTREEVLREMVAIFDFGNKDGVVTRAEFELYYRHMGASIDNDDYFELMIRNAWQMVDSNTAAGGASGPPKGFDKTAMLAKLQDEKSAPGTSASMPPAVMPAPPPTFDRPLTSRSRYALAQKAVISKQSAVQEYEAYISALVGKLRSQLIGDDGSGLITLQRKFRDADEDGSQALDAREFKRALRIFTNGLTDKDVDALFNLFDRDNTSSITYGEFVNVIRGRLNTRRQSLVDLAFNMLDTQGAGLLDPITVIKTYNPERHPDVLAHIKTAEQQRKEFLDAFDVGGQVEGAVTQDEFQNYHANLSAAISSDDFFEVMIRNVWRISSPLGSSGGGSSGGGGVVSARGAIASARSGGSRSAAPSLMNQLMGIAPPKNAPIEIPTLKPAIGSGGPFLGPAGGSMQGMQGYADAGAATVTAVPALTEEMIARAGPNAPSSSSAKPAGGSLPPRPRTAGPGTSPGLAAGVTPRPTIRVAMVRPTGPQPSSAIEPNPGVKMILTKLKTDIKSRGLFGYSQLQRLFRSMDVDDSKSLSLPEFSAAMKELKVNTSDKELRWLFEFFDKDNSGSVNFEEFITSVRDPLTEARQALVDLAFAKLDRGSTGEIDAHTLATSYDTNRHPEVIAERMTQNGATKEFFESFDMGGEVEGKVTANEFNNYYANIGAVISNDDYFDLLLRNTWQLGSKTAQPMNDTRLGGSAGSAGSLGLGGSQGHSMVSKLRGEVASAEDFTVVLEQVKGLQLQAVQKFQQKNYSKSIQIFEQILSIFKERQIPVDHPEYTRTEKSIVACKKKARMS